MNFQTVITIITNIRNTTGIIRNIITVTMMTDIKKEKPL